MYCVDRLYNCEVLDNLKLLSVIILFICATTAEKGLRPHAVVLLNINNTLQHI